MQSKKITALILFVVIIAIAIVAVRWYGQRATRGTGVPCLLECATADISIVSGGGAHQGWNVRIDKLFSHSRAKMATHPELEEGNEINLVFLETGALNNVMRTTSTPDKAVPVDEVQPPAPNPQPKIGEQYRANLSICLELNPQQAICSPAGEGWRGALLMPGS